MFILFFDFSVIKDSRSEPFSKTFGLWLSNNFKSDKSCFSFVSLYIYYFFQCLFDDSLCDKINNNSCIRNKVTYYSTTRTTPLSYNTLQVISEYYACEYQSSFWIILRHIQCLPPYHWSFRKPSESWSHDAQTRHSTHDTYLP